MEERTLDFIKLANKLQSSEIKQNAPRITEDIIKSTARVAPRTSGAIGYIPYIGDVADIGLGAYNMFTGHPLIGAGQLGIGTLGLASGGMGSKVVKGLARAGLKKAQRKPIEQLLRRTAKNPYKTRTLPSIALQSLVGDNSEQPVTITEEQINNSVPPQFSLLSDEELGVNANKLPPISSIAGVDRVPNVVVPQVSSQLQSTAQLQQPQNTVDNSAIARALIEMYGRQYNEMQQPQAEALQTYKRKLPWANISDALIRGGLASYAQAYDIPGLANAYTGSEYTNRLAKNYEIDQALANIPMNIFNAINTLAGNVAVANQMGLDPAVAMADKDIQKVLTAYNTMGSRENVANINAMARMYGADKTYEAKMYDTMIDNETARAIAQGKYDTAIQLQQLKNIGGARNALINASGFGATPADIQAVLSRFGYGPVGLNQQGTLAGQQTQVPGSFLDELR